MPEDAPSKDDSTGKVTTLPRLRILRKLSGKSQALVAAEVGVAKGTYSAWERGTNEVRSKYVVPLCRSLGCTPNDLFGYPEEVDGPSGGIFHLLDDDYFQFLDLYVRVPKEVQDGVRVIMEGTATSRRARVPRRP